jgi:hypothetical protein
MPKLSTVLHRPVGSTPGREADAGETGTPARELPHPYRLRTVHQDSPPRRTEAEDTLPRGRRLLLLRQAHPVRVHPVAATRRSQVPWRVRQRTQGGREPAGSMSQSTHSMCSACFYRYRPGLEPTLGVAPTKQCCACGGFTAEGIFVQGPGDQRPLTCNGTDGPAHAGQHDLGMAA